VPVSNVGKSPDALVAEIEAIAGGAPVIVFTDLQAGSCTLAARLSSREHPERAVLCGVNLPMLLDFVFHRDLPLDELVARLLAKGRQGVIAVAGPTAEPR
jgi:mannose/fructose-specific phosphotransferase system component IIA